MKKNLKNVSFIKWRKLKKVIFTMKLLMVLTLVAALNVSAIVHSQDNKLSIQAESIKLRDLLREIESKSNYAFFFNDQYSDLEQKITLKIQNENIEYVLGTILKNTSLWYKVLNNNFVVIGPKESLQEKTVSGKVVDSDGNPLPGVNVVEKGTLNGTATDENGNFSLRLTTDNPVLVFSYVGYNTEEVAVAGKTTINVTLIATIEKLEEIVVIGYGQQRKEAVTGSVASISGDAMREIRSANITQSLQGRIAGVELSRTTTKPGAGMQIRIRGERSLNASNDPLIVLDGIPFAGSLDDINPTDIKSIDILKDASATAIYGSRGANGVILITTHKGQKGQKASINYDGYVGLNTVFAKYPMMNGPEFVALRKAAGMYGNGPDEADDVNIDWQDLLYRTGKVINQTIGVSGGTETGNYTFGAGYYREEAVLPCQDFNRISWRGTFDQEVGKLFKFGFTSNNNYSISNGFNLGLYDVLSSTPIANPYNPDGTLKRTIRMPLDENWVKTKETVEALGDKWIDQTRTLGTYNTAYAEIKFPYIDGLKYRLNAGLDFRISQSGSYTGEGVFSANPKTESSASISNAQSFHWVVENLLMYDKIFKDKHQINFVGLYSAELSRYTRNYMSARNIPSDHFQFYNIGQALGEININAGDQYYEQSGLMSIMGRLMYSYDNRYMLSVAVRSDGSSRLAEGHKWHTYPAVSLGWNISNEPFMKNITQINLLKIKAGYGQTANQAISPYSTLGRLSTRYYNFGDDFAIGYYVSQLPNKNLGWEYSITYNVGLEFTLFNRRLSGTFEYYKTNTKDILLNVSLPITAGVGSYTANIGETENKGWELSLNGTIINNFKGFTWEAGVNFYANRNKIVKLASGQLRDEANWWFVGYPINVIFDYEKIGLWNQTDPDFQYINILEPSGTQDDKIGMIKVRYTGEYNEDGSPKRAIGPADRQIMSMEPDFQGGFNTKLTFKGFDLSMVGVFKSGGILISTLYSSNGYLNMLTGRRNNVKVDYWTPENTDAKYPRPGKMLSGDNPKYGSTLGYFDASFLKVRSITLGYNFSKKLTGLNRLRLYAQIVNPLVMFSPYYKESGMDPEPNSRANENVAVSYGYNLRRLLTIGTNTPSTRTYLFGVNVTF